MVLPKAKTEDQKLKRRADRNVANESAIFCTSLFNVFFFSALFFEIPSNLGLRSFNSVSGCGILAILVSGFLAFFYFYFNQLSVDKARHEYYIVRGHPQDEFF